METMLLHLDDVDLDTDRLAKGLPVSGVIYFTLGEASFPGDQWYDVVSVALNAWLPGLISFAQNHTDYCTLQFMDGPCRLKLVRQLDGTVTAVCLWNSKEQISQTAIDFPVFLDSVSACIRKYNRLLLETGFHEMVYDETAKCGKLSKILKEIATSLRSSQ